MGWGGKGLWWICEGFGVCSGRVFSLLMGFLFCSFCVRGSRVGGWLVGRGAGGVKGGVVVFCLVPTVPWLTYMYVSR